MQDTALVALFTGTSTAIAVALGAGWQVLGENLRARHERQRRLDADLSEREETRQRRLRRGLDRTRAAVLRLAVTVRVCADIREDPGARLHNDDLIEMLTRARQTYYEANLRIEALRALASPDEAALDAIDHLLDVVSDAYSHVRSAGSEPSDPDQVENLIRIGLREVSAAVLAD